MKCFFSLIALFGSLLSYGQAPWEGRLEKLMSNKRYNEVLRYLDSLEQGNADNSTLYLYRIRANEGLMRYNNAYRYARGWAARDTANRDIRMTLARLANLAGHKPEALHLYEQLAREDSLDFSVNYALGRLYQQNNRTGHALEVYMRQLAVDSSHVMLLTLIGDCLVEMELIAQAMNYYEKAFYEDIQNTVLAIKATNVILAYKDYLPYYCTSLSEMLNKAISIAPSSFPLRQTLGVLKYTDKRYSESEEVFAHLLADADSSRITLKYMGLVKYQQKKYGTALPFLSKAYPLYIGKNGHPTDIDLAMKYGETLCRTGSCGEALTVFELIETMMAPDKRFLSALEVMKGMSYTYIMKKEQAIASYWKAYQLNPANTGAIANFAYLSDRTGMDINQEELTDRDKKRIWFAQLLFLQKVREKPDAGPDSQHAHSRKVLGEALDELFFLNESKLVVIDPDGKEYSYPVGEIRSLIRRD